MSVAFALRANFRDEERYPDPRNRAQMFAAKTSLIHLAEFPPERLARIRMFSVHLPFCASELAGGPVVTLTLLRDPVQRVVSHLKHVKRCVPGYGLRSLEELYDVPWMFHLYFDNHQTRVFATRRDDPIELIEREMRHRAKQLDASARDAAGPTNAAFRELRDKYGWPFALDEARIATARRNLEHIDVLGFVDRHNELLETLALKYGLTIARQPPLNVGHDEDVPARLLDRIATDNRHDIEFYNYARELYERRRSHLDAAP